MKKIFTLALAAVLSVPMAMLATAQDDIYFSKAKTTKKALYAETSSDVWETSANSDWDIDTYNRRGVSSADSKEDSYAASYRQNYGTSSDSIDSQSVVMRDTVIQLVEVQVHDPYYWSSRIWRFHSPLFCLHHVFNPWYDYTFCDPWYYDPWYYDFYWTWNWGWGGLAWNIGWYDPFFSYSYYHGYNHGYYHGWHDGYYAHGGVHHSNGGHFNHHNIGSVRPQHQLASGARSYSRNRYAEAERALLAPSNGDVRTNNSRINTARANRQGGTRVQASASGASSRNNNRVTGSTSTNRQKQTSPSTNTTNSRSVGSYNNRSAHMNNNSSSSTYNSSSRNSGSYNSGSSSRSSSYSTGSSSRSSSGGFGGGGGFSGGGGSRSGSGGGGGSHGGRR